MTTTVTRDEFEDVKQMLASAARYAESANEKIDRVATQQELNTSAIGLLGQKVDQLADRVDALTVKVDALTDRVDELTTQVSELGVTVESLAQEAAQDRSQAAIDRAEFRSTVQQLLEVLTRQFNGSGNA